MMRIRLSTIEDIPVIMKIIQDAKIYLAVKNIDQWQNGYPNVSQIENDIKNQESYVLENQQEEIVATSMFTTNKEPTYKIIDGSWFVSEDEKYGVIHRMAIKKEHKKKGYATVLFKEFHQKLKDKGIKSLKIDTHADNYGMQNLIEKLGYKFCGTITTSYGASRLAYDKFIKP